MNMVYNFPNEKFQQCAKPEEGMYLKFNFNMKLRSHQNPVCTIKSKIAFIILNSLYRRAFKNKKQPLYIFFVIKAGEGINVNKKIQIFKIIQFFC